ncbi:histone-lysine N-methyltransferase SETMAR [Trichonephila clavata]|uniref:Histone-lysine N-methyltransferase SETMAR n=1 Tax=Trichonephila clavata TaxID=2740835 RepID=A0A8X6HSU3_TRICU|nr:histone-lysine N-methyltransferase SETMAR [Trichonephila clavata]
MTINKEKTRYILQFFFEKGENPSQVAQVVNGIKSPVTVTANNMKFWFHRFCSGKPVAENIDKIPEMIKVDQHFSSYSISKELKLDHKAILNYLNKAGFKKKLDYWVPHQLRQKTQDGSNFHLRFFG